MCKKLILLSTFVSMLVLAGSAAAQSPGDLELLTLYMFEDPSLDFQEDSGPQGYHIYHDGWMIGYYGGVSFDGPGYKSVGAYTPDYGEYDADSDRMEYAPFIYIYGGVWPNGSEDWTVDFMVNFGLDPWVDEPDIYGHEESDWWPWHHQCPFVAEGVFSFLEWQGSVTDFDTMIHNIDLNIYSDSTYDGGTPGDIPIADEWHHYCISVTATSVEQWWDGVSFFTMSGGFANSTDCSALYIGSAGWEWYMFAAKIDNFRIWKGWTATPPLPLGEISVNVSGLIPSDGKETVPCDVNEVCFKPPAIAKVMHQDPCADPCLLGPFEFYVYGQEDDPCEMPLLTMVFSDTNEQICVPIGNILPGKTYYWRVDVNDLNGGGNPDFYEGTPFSFIKWGYAINPDPEDGAEDMYPSVDPNWQNDGYAATFNAYFGDDSDDVDASEAGALVGNTEGFYDIAAGNEDQGISPVTDLLFGKTYYWRVDECNDPCCIPGDEILCVHGHIWSFTTGLCDPIEDFESYTNPGVGAKPINDYGNGNWGAYNTSNPGPIPDASNGGEVGLSHSWDDPDTVYEGSQAMKFQYYLSWTKDNYAFTVYQFDPLLNLEVKGTESITIEYRADDVAPPPAADDLYVELEDNATKKAKVYYTGDVTDPCWATVYMALSDFDTPQTPDMTKIKYIRIGAETVSTEDRYAVTYWDLLLRCAPFCRADDTHPMDLNGDCTIDENELGAMLEHWLEYDTQVQPEEPCDANLTLKYTFENEADGHGGLGDSSGNNYFGVPINDVNVHDGMLTILNEGSWWTWEVPNDMNAIQVGGDFNSVDTFTNSYTIYFEVRDHEDRSQNSYDYAHPIMYGAMTGRDGHQCQGEITWYQSYELLGEWGVSADHACVAGSAQYGDVADGNWHRIVFTYDADSQYHGCYVDGYGDGGHEPWGGDPWFDHVDIIDPSRSWDTLFGGTWGGFPMDEEGSSLMTGDFEEIRIYDYAVSLEEAMYLATGSLNLIDVFVDEYANMYQDGNPNVIDNDIVNLKDYAVFADEWMKEQLWPDD